MSTSPYIPLWLERAELSPTQFRVLAHLWHRAGKKGRCWPGADSIRRACRVSDDTLWEVIRALESRGLLRREKRRYNANVYVLLVPDVTPQTPVTVSPLETGEQLPDSDGQLAPLETGEQLPGSTGYKLSSGTVSNELKTGKGGDKRPSPAPCRFPWATEADLPPAVAMALSDAFPNAAVRAKMFAEIRGRKLKHKDDHSLADWRDVLFAEIAAARKAAPRTGEFDDAWGAGSSNKPADPTPTNGRPDGPAGWREWLAADNPHFARDGMYGATPWHLIPDRARELVLADMPKPKGEAA